MVLKFDKYTNPHERQRKYTTKIHANLIFQACVTFLRHSGNAGNLLSRVAGVSRL